MGDALPDHRLVAPVARRRTADAACAEVAVVETEIVGGQEQVLRTGLREHIQAVGPRPADLLDGLTAGDVDDQIHDDRHADAGEDRVAPRVSSASAYRRFMRQFE